MKQEKPIAYEPHPVSPERKAELIAGGFRIIDVVFMPAGQQAHQGLLTDGPTVAEFVAAGYSATGYPPHGYEPRSTPEEIAAAIKAECVTSELSERPDDSHPGVQVDGQGLGPVAHDKPADTNGDGRVTAAELKAALTAAGVTFKSNVSKSDLQALHIAFERSGLTGDEWSNLADEDRAARIAQ